MAGNELLPGSKPFAANYGGHQFGSWAGQLGDGRAMSLYPRPRSCLRRVASQPTDTVAWYYQGEVLNSSGERWELQLKGAGPTPYSRNSDGLALPRIVPVYPRTYQELGCSSRVPGPTPYSGLSDFLPLLVIVVPFNLELS
eukprot:1524730-Rhodomonas_salina.4